MRLLALVVAATMMMWSSPVPPAAAEQTAPVRIGLLIADHGEPPEYNEFTYWSFREFIRHLVEMGLIPFWLTVHDAGTILQDAGSYACESPRAAPQLIDAWLRPHAGPAAFVRGSSSLPSHYVIPGGPGLGEPDFYEFVGLSAWHEWRQMGDARRTTTRSSSRSGPWSGAFGAPSQRSRSAWATGSTRASAAVTRGFGRP